MRSNSLCSVSLPLPGFRYTTSTVNCPALTFQNIRWIWSALISWQGWLRSSSHGRSTANGRLATHGSAAERRSTSRWAANGWAANGRATANGWATANGCASANGWATASSRRPGVGAKSATRASCWTLPSPSGNPYAAGAFQRNAGASALYAQPASLIIWCLGELGSGSGKPAWRTCRWGATFCCMTWRPPTTDNLFQKWVRSAQAVQRQTPRVRQTFHDLEP